jgi:hypothetical protein
VAEAPDRFITAWDDETDASGANLIATQDADILGRRSYDEWAEFWPGSEIQPFASFINAVPKYVATSTRLERDWTNSRVIDGGLVDFVRHLKGRPGGDIGVHDQIGKSRGAKPSLKRAEERPQLSRERTQAACGICFSIQSVITSRTAGLTGSASAFR